MTHLNLQNSSPQTTSSNAFAVKLIPSLQAVLEMGLMASLGYGLYFWLVPYSYKTYDLYNAAIILSCLITVTLFYFAGLYQFQALTKFIQSADRVMIAISTTFVFLISLSFVVKATGVFSRIWVVLFFLTSMVALVAARALLAYVLAKLGQHQIIARRIVIYGAGEQLRNFLQNLDRSPLAFLKVGGVYTNDIQVSTPSNKNFDVLGNLDQLISKVRQNEIDDIFVALPWANKEQVIGVLERLRELPTSVYLCADNIGFSVQLREPPSYFQRLPLFEVIGKPLSGWDVIVKVLEDYILGTFLLILCIPIFLIVAFAIKLTSPGPIFFKQKRFGFNNQPFEIYKFRSMTFHSTNEGQTIQAKRSDPRITPIGRFLRRTSIDELPQLLNVLNGSMSLVGPRPHAVDHNFEYAQKISGYFARHRVKPGITGLAQIKGFRGETDTVEKMQGRVKYDIEYAETWSFMLDLKIMLLTVITVATGRNAY